MALEKNIYETDIVFISEELESIMYVEILIRRFFNCIVRSDDGEYNRRADLGCILHSSTCWQSFQSHYLASKIYHNQGGKRGSNHMIRQ